MKRNGSGAPAVVFSFIPSFCAFPVFFARNVFYAAPSLPLQYFEYTSRKEIRFNAVTELCAEVLEGRASIGMKHCPGDGETRPPSILWEFRQVQAPFGLNEQTGTVATIKMKQFR